MPLFFERLKRAFEGLPVSAALALDPAAENIVLNRAARAIFDVSPDQNVSITLPPALRPAPFRHRVEGREIHADEAPLQRAVRENRPIGPVEVTIESWNGDLIHSRIIAAPIHDADGMVAGGLALMLNLEVRATAQLAAQVNAIVGSFEYFDSIIAESLPHIVWVTDAGGAATYWNRRWQEYTGQTRAEALEPNGWLRAVHPDDRARAAAEFAGAVARGTTYEAEYRVLDASGSARTFSARGLPMRDLTGRIISWVGSCTDIENEKRALIQVCSREREFREVAESLPQIVWRASAEVTGNFYANSRWVEYSGMDSEATAGPGWMTALHPDDHARVAAAIERAVASGQGYDLEYRLRRRDGEYRRFIARCTAIHDPQTGAIASWLGTSTDIEDQKKNEDALKFIAESSVVLGRSLDLQETLKALVGLVVPRFGDCAWVNVDDGDALRTLAMSHREPARAETVQKLLGTCFINRQATCDLPSSRTGSSFIVSELTDDTIATFVDPRFSDEFRKLGLRNSCIVPIRGEHGCIGSVWIASTGATNVAAANIAVLEEIGVRAALAIANARLYERERRVAALLQAAQLPERLPAVRGVRLTAKYVAASNEAYIGGDWYDAFALADGRLVLTIGDVTGHGLTSIATMVAMRRSLRGIATVLEDPAGMLDAADRTLRLDGGEELVTACVGIFDPSNGRFTYASAGHHPPLLRDPAGNISSLFQPDLPLGLRLTPSVPSSSVTLLPGSALLFYTDGLIESDHDVIAGERRLCAAFERAQTTSADLAMDIVGAILPNVTSDDVAVLTLRYDAV